MGVNWIDVAQNTKWRTDVKKFNQPSGSIQRAESTVYPRNYQLYKKDSAPRKVGIGDLRIYG
jgi:hypothetical protein